MDCSEEVAVVRNAVEPLSGVTGISADIAQGIVTIRITKQGPSMAAVVAAITRSGLGAEPVTAAPSAPQSTWARQWREILTAIAGGSILLGATLHASQAGFAAVFADAGIPWWSQALYALAIVVSVGPLLPRAWGAIRGVRLDMNVLMVVAVIGAVVLGDWFEAATVGTLFALSLVLESWTARRAGRAIADLLKSTPQLAHLRATAGAPERDVPVAEVGVGSIVIVRPGETIPVDGRIQSGTSSINQAPITGESVPVSKTVGGAVFAGCVNGEGALEIETTEPAGDTMLARIARMVAESQQRRGSAERWIDRFAQIYTPVILVVAVAVAVIPGAVTGNWSWWLYQSLVLLVIACPCALVISVPVCIVAGIATAARAGVIIKGGAALEVAARVRAIAFDKTGTLTVGRPVVTDILVTDNRTTDALITLAATLEARSEHPVAHAVLERANELGIIVVPADGVVAIPGKGVQAANGAWAGSVAWAIERGGVPPALRTKLETALAAGSTVIVIGHGDQALGGITCRDQLRAEAAEALQGLRLVGIQRLIMLSGDADVVARQVAGQVGITESYGSLLPDAKVAKVAALAAEATPMAMVGDGLNDAPALARANLGVAMGSATAATLETADVALLSNDLRRLPWLVTHARWVMSVMKQNVIISLATKLIFVGLAVTGHGSMWIAIAADTGVSLLVVLNALRLLRYASAPAASAA
jgi:Zn2+/Cd2+-exporting ATPase